MRLKNTIIKPWRYCEDGILNQIKDAEKHEKACRFVINYLKKFEHSEWTVFDKLGKENEFDITYDLLKKINLDRNLALKKLNQTLWNEFLKTIFYRSLIDIYFDSRIKKDLYTEISCLDFNLENCHKAHELFENNALNLFEERIQIIFDNLKKYSLNSENIKNFKFEFHIPILNQTSIESGVLFIIEELRLMAWVFEVYENEDYSSDPTDMGYFSYALLSHAGVGWISCFVGTEAIQVLVDVQKTTLKIRFSEEIARALNQFV